jgi:hypothetical protein
MNKAKAKKGEKAAAAATPSKTAASKAAAAPKATAASKTAAPSKKEKTKDIKPKA